MPEPDAQPRLHRAAARLIISFGHCMVACRELASHLCTDYPAERSSHTGTLIYNPRANDPNSRPEKKLTKSSAWLSGRYLTTLVTTHASFSLFAQSSWRWIALASRVPLSVPRSNAFVDRIDGLERWRSAGKQRLCILSCGCLVTLHALPLSPSRTSRDVRWRSRWALCDPTTPRSGRRGAHRYIKPFDPVTIACGAPYCAAVHCGRMAQVPLCRSGALSTLDGLLALPLRTLVLCRMTVRDCS
ncbi:hypothetical protein FKP32DRAFT_1389045 [Trametes sanguinea]|nr:hypothetical protein FKP32DRAFT_1389045 [Trametes sanguinea]